jgi:hypothetical protein
LNATSTSRPKSDSRALAQKNLLANASLTAASEIDATTGWLAIATRQIPRRSRCLFYCTGKVSPEIGRGQRDYWMVVSVAGKTQGLDHDVPEAERSMQKGLAILKITEGTNSFRYIVGELAYSELLEHAGSHAEAARINSDANTTILWFQHSLIVGGQRCGTRFSWRGSRSRLHYRGQECAE